jgi:hypothetical protein
MRFHHAGADEIAVMIGVDQGIVDEVEHLGLHHLHAGNRRPKG